MLCIILLAATTVAAADGAAGKQLSPSGPMRGLPSPSRLWRPVSDDGRMLARGRVSARAVSPPPSGECGNCTDNANTHRETNENLTSVTVNGAACADPPATVVLDPGVAKRFRTPAYPNHYPNGASCGWKFVAYNGRPLDMHCDSVSLAPNDFFNFYDVTSQVQRSIDDVSGASISEFFTGDRVEASFESDASGTAEGFQCVIWSSTSESSSMVNDPTPSSTSTTQSPTTSTTTTAAPACQCGVKFGSRIVGGEPASPDEYPWMARINSEILVCGGSLISDRWIVTAAHCVTIIDTVVPWRIKVSLGYYRLSSPSSSSIKRTAQEIIRHPNYDETTFANDIALIRVDPIDWAQNPTIRPTCLPNNSEDLYSGSTGIVTGWGRTSSGGSSSDTLMEVSVPIISNSKCEEYLGQPIHSSMICAGEEAGGVDACQGDSGGPMVVMDGPNAELVGVVSWGYGCAEPRSPGVYARVTEFLPWIQTSTSGSEYCPRS